MNPSNTVENCVFCKLMTGQIPSYKVYEDDHTFAFLTDQPNNLGHTLVIPKDHFENIYDTPDEQFCRVMITARKIALAVKNSLDADGINIIMNNESAAGQAVSHAHVHVIPRYNDDGFKGWSEEKEHHKTYKEGEQESIVKRIQTEIA